MTKKAKKPRRNNPGRCGARSAPPSVPAMMPGAIFFQMSARTEPYRLCASTLERDVNRMVARDVPSDRCCVVSTENPRRSKNTLSRTGVAINSGHAGNLGNRVIGLASRDVMKNFEAENFARDLEQIDHF